MVGHGQPKTTLSLQTVGHGQPKTALSLQMVGHEQWKVTLSQGWEWWSGGGFSGVGSVFVCGDMEVGDLVATTQFQYLIGTSLCQIRGHLDSHLRKLTKVGKALFV